jgi:hypothetical protein
MVLHSSPRISHEVMWDGTLDCAIRNQLHSYSVANIDDPSIKFMTPSCYASSSVTTTVSSRQQMPIKARQMGKIVGNAFSEVLWGLPHLRYNPGARLDVLKLRFWYTTLVM